jgi:hypothetical protein
VVVGDSLSADVQNGSLLDRQQVQGHAALVAAARADAELLTPEKEFDEDHRAVMARLAATGATLVDVRAALSRADRRGYVVGGQWLTTDSLGGLFSLDGIHPTNTGYAIIANEFIKTLNRESAAGIPPVPVRQVQKHDPLVLPGVGHPAGALGALDADTAAALLDVLAR